MLWIFIYFLGGSRHREPVELRNPTLLQEACALSERRPGGIDVVYYENTSARGKFCKSEGPADVPPTRLVVGEARLRIECL
jgi:hypothetical protein